MSTILNPSQDNPELPLLPALDYKQMNALGLDELKDDLFDCVLVKGTLDALLCAGHKGRDNALLLLAEAYRVLKPTGVLVCIRWVGVWYGRGCGWRRRALTRDLAALFASCLCMCLSV